MTTIKPFPALLDLAESEARDQYESEAALARAESLGDAPDEPGDWDWLGTRHPEMRSVRVRARIGLLTDMRRAESRDAVARIVAEKVGLKAGATAPMFCRSEPEQGDETVGQRPPEWFLGNDENDGISFVEPWSYFAAYGGIVVPGISSIADPASALAAIVAALWPGAEARGGGA